MPKAGRYHIERKIADGGMAEIFVGTQHGAEGFERPVVLKRILAPLVADPQFRNMLIDEAHVAMGLNHSNIVQVLDLGHVRGRYFLVLELVDGWDLSQILARAKNATFPVPPEILLYIAAEVCRALAYAHARTRDGRPLAIVHRDVSPQNVLISEQGEVKLTDFGIAKAMGRREHTSQGVIKGKLAFMSPEQASGSVLDNRSDLFALGTILYLFFTGRRPFEAPTDLESIVLVRECRFPSPESIKPDLGGELVKLIRRAMQRLPSERFQSADEMLLAIENVQRTAYRPAGQTELKRWLADLQARDHCPTTSRAAAAPRAVPESMGPDVGEGAEVVFDESNQMDIEDVVQGTQPTISASAEILVPTQPKEPKTTAATPIILRQSSVPARIILFSLIVCGLAIGAYLVIPDQDRRRAKRALPPPPPKPTTAVAKQTKVEPAPPPLPVPSRPLVEVAKSAVDVSKPAVDASPPSVPQASGNPTVVAAPSEAEEEENLLKNAEPEDRERVIEEDEGVAKQHKPASIVRQPIAAVSVHVVSTPEGAVIGLGRRVFGRAPMNLRFRPGISYELSFVKKGYQSATKRFMVLNRSNQTFRIALKKKPPAKKSFFRRIFGSR